MLSRVADTIFWMYRYLERAENNARFLDVNFNLVLDLPAGTKEQWKPLVITTGGLEEYLKNYEDFRKNDVIRFIGFDERNPNSIFSCLRNARENARMVRENLTKELWEEINDLYLFVFETVKKDKWLKSDPRKFFTKVKKGCQNLWGINESTISRNDGWHFGQLGQSLERADNTSRVLDVKYHILLPSVESVGTPIDIIHWASLLKSVSAYNMYRRHYGKILPVNVTQFLILEKEFPRSILFCLQKAEFSLRKISGIQSSGFANQAEKKLGSLRSDLEFADINDIFTGGLHEYLDDLQKKISVISNVIYETYFDHNIH
jgi:uncharacterized alpha-E superfamily protein